MYASAGAPPATYNAMLPFPMIVAAPKPIPMYLGTYTEGTSRGIYRATLDRETGAISAPALVAECVNPSYLALKGDRLYACLEEGEGGAAAFRIGSDGALTALNVRRWAGGGSCHVSVGEGHLFVANYGAGSIAVMPLERDESLGEPTLVKNTGKGTTARQEASHLHFVQPYGGRIYACDLGTDEILVYPFSAGVLGQPDRTMARGGGGPRHMAFGKGFAYANHELDNTVTAYAIDAYGALTVVQTLSSLPSDYKGESYSAEIALHPNGRWLYVSNRRHDSIATFAVTGDGTLSLTAVQAAGVREPRGFGIDPSGRWMVVAGQNSDGLVSYPLDPKTGVLGSATGRATVGKPTCVVFG